MPASARWVQLNEPIQCYWLGHMERGNSPIAKKEKRRSPGKEETHSQDGVDLTLIRWMLSLTPAERLQVLQQSVQSLLRLRDGKAGR